MSRRGRKSVGHSISIQDGPFKCSECEFITDKYLPCEEHIARDHQGLARINGLSVIEEPMDRNEMIGWVKKAQAILKVLRCKNCPKEYSSALGFVCHVELCGKTDDELKQECEYCGKKLMISSLQQHMRSTHFVKKDSEDVIEEQNPDNRRRRSAIIAKKNFSQESEDSDTEEKTTRRSIKKKIDDDFQPGKEDVEDFDEYAVDDCNTDEDSNLNSTLPKKIKKESSHSDRTISKAPRLARVFQNDFLKQLRNNERHSLYEYREFHPKKICKKPFTMDSLGFLPIPFFKSTSMQAEGNNDMQKVEPFKGCQTPKSCFINIGFEIQASAWCPQQLPSDALNSKKLYSELLKDFQTLKKPRQYLAILTTCSEDLSNKNKQYLQIWKFDSNNDIDNHPCNPEMQLLIKFDFSKIFDIKWCPNGATFEKNINVEKLQSGIDIPRLGLLAAACEDSQIRIYSIPHGVKSFEDEYYYYYYSPVLTLKDREQFSPCTCFSWSHSYPYSQIIGGYQSGTICLWNLDKMALSKDNDEYLFSDTVYPTRVFLTPQRTLVNEIKWLNCDIFMTTHHDKTIRIWNLNVWSGIYDTWEREFNIIQKIETHPTWHDSFILLDFPIKRKSDVMITYKTLDGAQESTSITHWKNIVLNDISLSPWQYILVYGTVNGSLHFTAPLKFPYNHQRKIDNFVCMRIQLGDMQKNRDDISEDEQNSFTKNKNKNSKKKNELLNKCVDMNFDSRNFFDRFYLIFNDQCCAKLEAKDLNDTYMTKNDSDYIYSITNVEWCPNMLTSDWFFYATKSGLCCISHQHFDS